MNHDINKHKYIKESESDNEEENTEMKMDDNNRDIDMKQDDNNNVQTMNDNEIEDDNEANFDGLLVRKDFNYHIMAPKDLSNFTPLTSAKLNNH